MWPAFTKPPHCTCRAVCKCTAFAHKSVTAAAHIMCFTVLFRWADLTPLPLTCPGGAVAGAVVGTAASSGWSRAVALWTAFTSAADACVCGWEMLHSFDERCHQGLSKLLQEHPPRSDTSMMLWNITRGQRAVIFLQLYIPITLSRLSAPPLLEL